MISDATVHLIGIITRAYKELKKLNIKEQVIQWKMGKWTEQKLLKRSKNEQYI
jgi:hypothetical protein